MLEKNKAIQVDSNQPNFHVIVFSFACILSLAHSMLLLTSEHDLQSFLCPAQISHQHDFSAMTWKVMQKLKLHKRGFRAVGCELVMRLKMILIL